MANHLLLQIIGVKSDSILVFFSVFQPFLFLFVINFAPMDSFSLFYLINKIRLLKRWIDSAPPPHTHTDVVTDKQFNPAIFSASSSYRQVLEQRKRNFPLSAHLRIKKQQHGTDVVIGRLVSIFGPLEVGSIPQPVKLFSAMNRIDSYINQTSSKNATHYSDWIFLKFANVNELC